METSFKALLPGLVIKNPLKKRAARGQTVSAENSGSEAHE